MGRLWVEVRPPRPAQRGALARLFEEAVEDALARRGAAPPGFNASADLGHAIADQLYRARLLEYRGFSLFVPDLAQIADLENTLDAEDGAVLRFFIHLARERPLDLWLATENGRLRIHGPPVPLTRAISEAEFRAEDPEGLAPRTAPEQARSSQAMQLSVITARGFDEPGFGEPGFGEPGFGEQAQRLEPEIAETEPEEELDADLADVADEDETTQTKGPEREAPERYADSETLADLDDDGSTTHPEADDSRPEIPAELVDGGSSIATESGDDSQGSGHVTEAAQDGSATAADVIDDDDFIDDELDRGATAATALAECNREEPAIARQPTAQPPAVPQATQDPFDRLAQERWQRWLSELNHLTGPKPLAVIERLFVSGYVPLREALVRGIAPAHVEHALTHWAASFEKSYREAFAALCMRGKRPTMVLDVPELAHRIARLHGAKSVQLILVDGLRFDIGLRVHERLKRSVEFNAALTERLLLWAALPSNTETQLELLGKGAPGLRELRHDDEPRAVVARGVTAAAPRRIKSGQRELFKLDLIEAQFAEPGGPILERLDRVADSVAAALASHFAQLPARTLVMVFGDHGFLTEALGPGTSAAHQGGASPDEVLVPAFAWLTGRVH